MAKRLTKALRGKRRWVGVAFGPDVKRRSEASTLLESAFSEITSPRPIRLMDFHPSTSEQAGATRAHLAKEGGANDLFSYGIIEVPHEVYQDTIALVRSDGSLDKCGLFSLTSSGKIRLVRERLALERPPRRR